MTQMTSKMDEAIDRASTARITKTLVDGARPGRLRYAIWDSKLAGFGVRIAPSGAKTYIARYRTLGGRAGQLRQVTIGRHGKLTPEQAREAADRIISAATLGGDPAAERGKARADITVAELCELYFQEGCATKKPLTLYTDKGRVRRHIVPLLGSRRVQTIMRADIERFMAEVASGGTRTDQKTRPRGRAIVKGGPGAATRVIGLLGGIFTFAVNRGLRPDNPVRGIKRFKDKRMERFLTPAEMAALGEALNAMGIAVIRLLMVTGCRKNEIQALRWPEVDAAWSCLRLADSKTGQKVVPIGASALEILAKIERTESAYVFPASDGQDGAYQGVDKVWRIVRQSAGLDNVRLHDLRHSFASAGVLAGYGLPMLGKLLGHADTATTARYAHLADDPTKLAADRIAAVITAAMNGQFAAAGSGESPARG